jgi:hypothetical protein
MATSENPAGPSGPGTGRKKPETGTWANGTSTGLNGRTSLLLAVAGILAGLGLILAGLIVPPLSGTEETDVVARVNGQPISTQRFYQLALGLNDERRAGGRPTLERSEILERLIEEELFVDRAVELGLPYTDKIVRGYLINSLLTMITDGAMNATPSRSALETFFEENQPWFIPAGKAAVRLVFVAQGGEDGRIQAEAVRTVWEKLPSGEMEFRDPLPIEVPQTLVPLKKLADYLGSETAGKIARLAVGEAAAPGPWMGGWVVARCMDRTAGEAPAFDSVEAQVLETWRRRQAEEAYRDYMEELRHMADIRIVGGQP